MAPSAGSSGLSTIDRSRGVQRFRRSQVLHACILFEYLGSLIEPALEPAATAAFIQERTHL